MFSCACAEFLRTQNRVVGIMDLTFHIFLFSLCLAYDKFEKLSYTKEVKNLYLKGNDFVVEVVKILDIDHFIFFFKPFNFLLNCNLCLEFIEYKDG